MGLVGLIKDFPGKHSGHTHCLLDHIDKFEDILTRLTLKI